MCSMDERKVGVRELRQNLSVYLRRVQRGERLEVTDHGRPVAVLAPIGDLLDLLPPKGRPSTRVSEALLEERAERL